MSDLVERLRGADAIGRTLAPGEYQGLFEQAAAAVEKGEYLAQAAGRAMRDRGGPTQFLDLNAAVHEFRAASGTGPSAVEQSHDK